MAEEVRAALGSALCAHGWICLSAQEVKGLPGYCRQQLTQAAGGEFLSVMSPGHRTASGRCESRDRDSFVAYNYRVTSSKMGSYKYLEKYQALALPDHNRNRLMFIVGNEAESLIPAVSISRNAESGPFIVFKENVTYKFLLVDNVWGASTHDFTVSWSRAQFSPRMAMFTQSNRSKEIQTHHQGRAAPVNGEELWSLVEHEEQEQDVDILMTDDTKYPDSFEDDPLSGYMSTSPAFEDFTHQQTKHMFGKDVNDMEMEDMLAYHMNYDNNPEAEDMIGLFDERLVNSLFDDQADDIPEVFMLSRGGN